MGERPTPREQAAAVEAAEKLAGDALRDGDTFYAVSAEWWKSWMDHTAKGGASPEIVDNSDLADDSGALRQDGVNEGVDYVLKHERVWKLLHGWYGATDSFSGKVVRNAKNEACVDLHPVHFSVFRVGPKETAIRRIDGSPLRVSAFDELRSLFGKLQGYARVDNPDHLDSRLWVCEASSSEFNLLREEDMEQLIRDVLTGTGKWNLLIEFKDKGSRDWLCGSGDEPLPLTGRAQPDPADAESSALSARRRAESFVRDRPAIGQHLDVRRRKDNRWHEGIVAAVNDNPASEGGVMLLIHFLSFPTDQDEEFAVGDTESLAPPYTRVPDWRTQLRKDEEVEVHRRVLRSPMSFKSAWLVGKVKRFSRAVATPPASVAGGSSDPTSDNADNDLDMAEVAVGPVPTPLPNGRPAASHGDPKRKRTSLSTPERPAPPQPPLGSPVAARGQVLVELRAGSIISQRKEVWIDLDSENIAHRYTHLPRPTNAYGPQGIEGQPLSRGIVGLRNLGNTCFMNSMLQCLSFTLPLTDYFLCGDYEGDLNRKNPLGTGGKLAEAYAGLIQAVWSDRFSVVPPNSFKQQLGRAFTQFSGYQQQDSHELFSLLVDGLHEDLNRVRKKPYTEPVESNGRPDHEVAVESWEVFRQRNDSVVVDTMMGLLRSHLTCPKCNTEAVKFDPYSNWSVPIPKKTGHSINVVLYPLAGPGELPQLKRFVVDVPRGANSADAAQKFSEMTGISLSDLFLATVDSRKVVATTVHDPFSRDRARPISDYAFKSLEDRDVIAWELGPRVEGLDESDYRAVEVRFTNETLRSQSFRLSEVIAAPVAATGRELHALVWNRVRGLFKEGYSPPASFLRRFGGEPPKNGSESPSEAQAQRVRAMDLDGKADASLASDEDGDTSDAKDESTARDFSDDTGEDEEDEVAPYFLNSSAYSTREIACNDTRAYSSLVYIEMSKGGIDALRDEFVHGINNRRSYFETVEERDSMYSMGPISYDASAKVLTEKHGSNIKLSACIERFREREQLGENDEWFCPNCKDLVQAFKEMDLWTAPEVLVVHLKRFYYERNQYIRSWVDREKINDLVDFPLEGLDLTEYIRGYTEGEPAPIYDLYAVSNHIGGMGGGHYTAYVKDINTGKWFLMDDSRTSEASEKEIVSPQAYVLFYRRRPSASSEADAGCSSASSSSPMAAASSSTSNGDVDNNNDGGDDEKYSKSSPPATAFH